MHGRRVDGYQLTVQVSQFENLISSILTPNRSGPRMLLRPTGATIEVVVTGLAGALPLLTDADLLLTAETADAADPAPLTVEAVMMAVDDDLPALLLDEQVRHEMVTMPPVQVMLPRMERLRDPVQDDTEMSRALLLPTASDEKVLSAQSSS